MTDRKPHTVRVYSGKYTLINHGSDIEMLRYGQPWHRQSEAGNAIAALMCELDAARVVLQVGRELTADWRAGAQARLEAALRKHDALVSDNEPPSAWCGIPVGSEASMLAARTIDLEALKRWRSGSLPWAIPRDDDERAHNAAVTAIDLILSTSTQG